MIKRQLPRGIRNNNPLNIRIGNVWLGEVSEPTDPDFEQFVSMEYGLRAAFVLLRRYIRHYKRTTIAQIISAWAPRNENNTTLYIDKVVQLSGIAPDTQLKFEDVESMLKLVSAMAYVENGREIDMKKIQAGYNMT